MNLKERIEKLLKGDNQDDWEIAMELLESDELSMDDKIDFIEDYLNNNRGYVEGKIDKLWMFWLRNYKNKYKN